MGFSAPESFLGGLDAHAVGALVTAAADVALIVDREGVVRDSWSGVEGLGGSWRGTPLADCVTEESRDKIHGLLDEVDGPVRWRQVNHPVEEGDVPVQYNAVRIGAGEHVMVLGRDMRRLLEAQRELVAAQQNVERDYWKLRQVEARYGMLFQLVSDAVLVIDGRAGEIWEANAAAQRLLGRRGRVGKPLAACFEDPDAFAELLDAARFSGRAEQRTLPAVRELRDASEEQLVVAALPFKQEDSLYFFVSLTGAARAESAANDPQAPLLDIIRAAPDGVVLADERGVVVAANVGFVDLVGATHEGQVLGERLDRWLGRSGVEQAMLIGTLRQGDPLRAFSTVLNTARGETLDIEISGVVVDGAVTRYGFVLRDVSRRADHANGGIGATAVGSTERLKELVGRVPLKELVRESSDMIEKLCIEAALELTANNRASAAELLGLSRQSLYVKLRRYGLGSEGA